MSKDWKNNERLMMKKKPCKHCLTSRGMKKLKDVSAIVTGGGSGLGEATARALADAGCKVAIWDMNKSEADKVAQDIGGIALECDVSDAKSAEAALKASSDAHGPARILVNCAGVLGAMSIVNKDGSPADYDAFCKTIEINLCGTFNTTRLVAAEMSTLNPVTDSGERGVIINTSSIAAFEGQIGQAAYTASKAAIVGMTRQNAGELAKLGIRVMSLSPGAMATPMVKSVKQEILDGILKSVWFPKRLGEVDEFAEQVLNIVKSEMLNGSNIRLDGAARLNPK